MGCRNRPAPCGAPDVPVDTSEPDGYIRAQRFHSGPVHEEVAMEEIFPVGSGVVLGLVIAYLASGRLRGWILAAGSVLIGATASWASGELAVSWLYLFVDIGQVLLAGALTWVLALSWRRLVGVARREV